jgi:hypothetical protein
VKHTKRGNGRRGQYKERRTEREENRKKKEQKKIPE